MKQIKIVILGLMLVNLLFSCQKDTPIEEIKETTDLSLQNTPQNDDGSVTFRSSEDDSCSSYEDFESAFCVLQKAISCCPPPLSSLSPTNGIDSWVYTDRKITLTTGGKTVIAKPIRNIEDEIDFELDIEGKTYVLTKSEDIVIQSKAIPEEVPNYLEALYLIKDEYLQEGYLANDLEDNLNNAGTIISGNNDLEINITSPHLIPADISQKMFLIFRCDWEKARTINRYLSRIGWPNNDLTLYPFYVETALDECGWTCGECSDPICVFSQINELLGDQSDVDDLHSTFLEYTTDLGEDEIPNFLSTFQANMASVVFTSGTSGNFCIDYLSIESQLASLIENPDYLNDLELAPCPNDGTVFDGQIQFCNDFFEPCTISPTEQFRTTGIRCFRAQFNINGELDEVVFGSIFFKTENNNNCTLLCSNAATVAMNQAYGQTQQAIISQGLTDHVRIRGMFLIFLGRNMANFSLTAGCVGADSPIPFTNVILTSSYIDKSDTYDTVFIIFNETNFPGC